MKSRYEDKFKTGAEPYLEPGEEVLTAFIAQARGRGQAMSGNLVAGELGARQARKARAGAEAAGLVIEYPMAIAVTNQRLLTLKITTPVLGRGGEVTELLSAVGLRDVDSVHVRRFGLGKRITITVNGANVELEGNVGANEFAEAFEHVKAQMPTLRAVNARR